MDSFSLVGQVALVTGAGRGIGQALSLALAEAGASVIVTGRDPQGLVDTTRMISTIGREALVETIDVGSASSIDAAFSRLAAQGRSIDILVNNAGVETVRPSVNVDEALWDTILDTNLKGAFFCSRAFARLPHGGGPRSILNLCSLTSEVGIPTAVAYGSSKTGLVGMTRALSAEWAALDIRVNGIGPGYVRTAMTQGFFDDPAWQRAALSKTPLRRFGALEDLMGAAVFLSSKAAAYITGQVLYIDGGTLAAL